MLTDEVTGPINLGNHSEFTILELAEKVISFTIPIEADIQAAATGRSRQRQPDLSKAKTCSTGSRKSRSPMA